MDNHISYTFLPLTCCSRPPRSLILSSSVLNILLFLTEKPSAPDAPLVSNIKATSVDLQWSPPKHDGGAPILSYIVEYKAATQHRWIKSAQDVTDTTHRVSGIVEGYDYEFRVAACNKAGTGQFSEPSKSVLVKEKIGEP